jgi:hypothetical protein
VWGAIHLQNRYISILEVSFDILGGSWSSEMSENDDRAGAGDPPRTPEQLMAAINERLTQVESVLGRLAYRQYANDWSFIGVVASIVSSGFFFIVLGGALLFFAQAHMSTNHAGITFVLVVLGVALLLYGTGTQGMGQFSSGTNAGYNIAIAGGAGVVAFAVAYGIIMYSTEMRNAFQPERKFVRVLVQGGDGLTDIAQYASTFEMDGVPVPAARKGRSVEVYVPYLPYEIAKVPTSVPGGQTPPAADDKGMCPTVENREAASRIDQRATSKLVSARFYRVEAGSNPDTLLARAETDFIVRLDQGIFRSSDGGIDYPSYPVRICVNLQQVDRAIASAQLREISNPGTNKLKPNLPPALIEAQ